MDLQKIIPLIARTCLAVIFLRSGAGKVLDFAGTQEQIAGAGLPLAALMTVGAIVFELVGAVLVLLGYKAKWGALLLILFLIPTTLLFHTNFAEGMQVTQFFKNLAILGGLLMVTAFGSGPLSLENRFRSRRRFGGM
ncbi:DoxX family protein [Cyanobacteria bacterium FACHB-471]|nr:DoxX family protein [Cyanobacteria bacterium FACHB-471]